MAKQSLINRELKRQKVVKRYEGRRAKLVGMMSDSSLSDEERFSARLKFQALPRDASPVRLHTRCRITGRARGVYRKFGLGRSKLREIAFRGEIPGLTKASW